MKVVLSRKGFDSSDGGCPSPILPDGSMVSMPIPDPDDPRRYDDLLFPDGRTYMDAWKDLSPRDAVVETCHLDPDIRNDIRRKAPVGWEAAFGQRNSAEGHLENKGVQVGDLFLFFGLFRKTQYRESRLVFDRGAGKMHVIYGYLQIGRIVRRTDARQFPWHPHSDDRLMYDCDGHPTNNTIYVASRRLVIGDKDMGLPGAGAFPFSEKRVLTAPGMNQVTRWKLNGVFGEVPLSYHYDPSRVQDGYFQSVSKGQEFVFDEDIRVNQWAESLFDE